jgi:hypothetical protein
MRNLLFIAIAVTILPGCIGTKRYTRFVQEACPKDTFVYSSSANVAIKSALQEMAEPVVKVEQGDHHFIPALFYWGIKENYQCDLNPGIPLNTFRKVCSKFVSSDDFIKKLDGNQREITVNALPRHFAYVANTQIMYFLIAVATVSQQGIYPEINNLNISYKVYNDKGIVKQGSIEEVSHDHPFGLKNKSGKKVTKRYFLQYRKTLWESSVELMNQLYRKI